MKKKIKEYASVFHGISFARAQDISKFIPLYLYNIY